MRKTVIAAAVLMLGLASSASAQDTTRPPVEFILEMGEAGAAPVKRGVSWANGGVIDVAQPNPTTLVVTMSGITATNADLCRVSVANYTFELAQGFAIAVNSQRVKSVKLLLESRVNGILRSSHDPYTRDTCFFEAPCGTAETKPATAAVACHTCQVLAATLPARATSGCADLSVYNHDGPFEAPVCAGHYMLHETWGFGTTHPAFICRGASAEFAPEPGHYQGPHAYWFEHFQPFSGTATRSFGYQVTLKLVPEFKPPERTVPQR